jgi:hypothetical protein
VDARERAVIAEIVEVLADGLRLDLETAGEIVHHHPTEGAGDIEDFGLAVGQAGHNSSSEQQAPWCGGSGIRSTRQMGCSRGLPLQGRITVKVVRSQMQHQA